MNLAFVRTESWGGALEHAFHNTDKPYLPLPYSPRFLRYNKIKNLFLFENRRDEIEQIGRGNRGKRFFNFTDLGISVENCHMMSKSNPIHVCLEICLS